jgi:hypothetical protein
MALELFISLDTRQGIQGSIARAASCSFVQTCLRATDVFHICHPRFLISQGQISPRASPLPLSLIYTASYPIIVIALQPKCILSDS